VAVLATGGTIATRTDGSGTAVARVSGRELAYDLSLPSGGAVEAEDVFRVGSYAMTLEHLQKLAVRVGDRLGDDVAGVVITNGTDTTEETAMFLDLVLDGSCSPRGGPRRARPSPQPPARPRPDRLGWVRGGALHVEAGPRRRPGRALRSVDLNRVRVDIAACYPGADGTALRAFAAAGAHGIVLQATGAGNANPAICDTVAELAGCGLVIVTSTRVPVGAVVPIYGNGGGADLVRAGAIPRRDAAPAAGPHHPRRAAQRPRRRRGRTSRVHRIREPIESTM
jgi:L-asparaginase